MFKLIDNKIIALLYADNFARRALCIILQKFGHSNRDNKILKSENEREKNMNSEKRTGQWFKR